MGWDEYTISGGFYKQRVGHPWELDLLEKSLNDSKAI
jgi:hypothetical protein